MATELYLPKMSDHMESGTIGEWLVKVGDTVVQGQPVLEIETDKVNAEIEAPASGVLRVIRAGAEVPGTEIRVGETIAIIADADEEITELPPLEDA
ncbi:MAG: biotin/lipoyl-containing protein [Chloroflexota bacterium]